MKKRETIIESAIGHSGLCGFDAISTFEFSHEADGTQPLIYYLISHFVDIPKHTATVYRKISNILFRKIKYSEASRGVWRYDKNAICFKPRGMIWTK